MKLGLRSFMLTARLKQTENRSEIGCSTNARSRKLAILQAWVVLERDALADAFKNVSLRVWSAQGCCVEQRVEDAAAIRFGLGGGRQTCAR